MANQILTTDIDDSAGRAQPWLGPSLQFMQNATSDQIKAIIEALVGRNVTANGTGYVFIMWGCVRTGAADGASSGAAAVTAGAIAADFAGTGAWQIYDVPAFSTANINGQYLALANSPVTTTYDTSIDPITMSDGTTTYAHQINTCVITLQTISSPFYNVNNWYNIMAKPAMGLEDSGTTYTLVAATPHVLTFDTIVKDYSEFNSGTSWYSGGKFTPLRSGWYRITFGMSYVMSGGSITSGSVYPMKFGIYVNGAAYSTYSLSLSYSQLYADASNYIRETARFDTLVYLNESDYLQIMVSADSSGGSLVGSRQTMTLEFVTQ